MHITTQGLVLREVAYKETDKILTLLTKNQGKVTVTARGCRKKSSPLAAGCQLLAWSEFVLYEYKGRWSVKEVAVDREFSGLRLDLLRFSLACYFAELTEALSIEDLPQPELLSLVLNCLHVLEKKTELPVSLVKGVFEFRLACQSGYEPILDCCSRCENPNPINPQLSLLHGTIHCKSCGVNAIPLTSSTLSALRFIAETPAKQLFSFQMAQPNALTLPCERYLLTQLDRPFATLDFYKSLLP